VRAEAFLEAGGGGRQRVRRVVIAETVGGCGRLPDRDDVVEAFVQVARDETITSFAGTASRTGHQSA